MSRNPSPAAPTMSNDPGNDSKTDDAVDPGSIATQSTADADATNADVQTNGVELPELMQESAPTSAAPVTEVAGKRPAEQFVQRPRIESPTLWLLAQRGAALLMILALSPMFITAYLLIRLTSRGPFLFRQQRRGFGGEPFEILKMRTMSVGAESKTRLGVSQGSSHVTRVGAIFRKLKIDELTQLWNIVRGDMEIVGPRPIPVALEDELRGCIPDFVERNRVRPGLTSFSQVVVVDNGTGDRLVEDWTERFQAELHYIRRKSLGYDLVVIVMSALYLFRSLLSLLFRGRAARRVAAAAGKTERRFATTSATQVLGVPILNGDYDDVLNQVSGWVQRKESHYIAICPVHSVVESVLHEDHRRHLENASLNTPDGVPVVWAQKLLGFRKASRVYGPTLMKKAFTRAERNGWRVGFYGGHPERLQMLVDRTQLEFPKLQIVTAISPPFRALTPEEDAEMMARIRSEAPDLLMVGLGCPKQEKWMAEHSAQLPSTMFGVGAAFDFHAKTLRVAPPFLQKIGMEWFFRLCCEPRRLFKRYATTNPIYVVLVGLQICKRFLLFRSYQVAGADTGKRAEERNDSSAAPK